MFTDFDMVPNGELDLDLEDYVSNQTVCDTCALVFPLFELQAGLDVPRQKNELARMVVKGQARLYQLQVSKINQKSSDIPRWV